MTVPALFRKLALLLILCAAPAFAAGPVKVVYHLSEGLEQASNGLRNIQNHLSVAPTAKIVVVAHAGGIDFLLKGAKDRSGNEYETVVGDLVLAGVEFRVCNITLQSRSIDPKRLIADVKLVPSGVAEVARLQAEEGYAYLKP
jgi:intracellular sulfur oxidation DsrE/DsrF family protein